MTKGHTNRSRRFKFENRDTMLRFILLYKDLFVPYSEDYILCRSYVKTTPTTRGPKGKFISRGYHDENIVKMLEQGYDIRGEWIKVNLEKDSFDEILKYGNFEKVRIQRGQIGYVWKAA